MAGSRGKAAAVFVLSMAALGGLAYLAWATDSHPLVIGLLVAIPLFAAIFLSPGSTTVIGVLVLAAAGALAWLTSDGVLEDYYVPLIAVAVSVIVAIVSSTVKRSMASPDSDVGDLAALNPAVSVNTDPMTGLLNRRGAIRVLGSRNANSEKVLAFLDCDLFRLVNESYGTAVGDEFLQAIAGRLRHSLPARDTVVRWDDDEFLVVMSADPGKAMPALGRVVGAINKHPIRTSSGPVEASMSVGAAVWAPGQDLEDVVSRAGRALHTAKSRGRAQMVLDAGPETDPEPSASSADPLG